MSRYYLVFIIFVYQSRIRIFIIFIVIFFFLLLGPSPSPHTRGPTTQRHGWLSPFLLSRATSPAALAFLLLMPNGQDSKQLPYVAVSSFPRVAPPQQTQFFPPAWFLQTSPTCKEAHAHEPATRLLQPKSTPKLCTIPSSSEALAPLQRLVFLSHHVTALFHVTALVSCSPTRHGHCHQADSSFMLSCFLLLLRSFPRRWWHALHLFLLQIHPNSHVAALTFLHAPCS